MTPERDAGLLQRHMPGLDVLRGIAILSVLVYHGFYWSVPYTAFPGRWQQLFVYSTVFGWLGVNLFFVLSGFLITGILLDARQNHAYFAPFYLRRVVRILPAYLLCIVILLSAGWVTAKELPICLLYLTNLTIFGKFLHYGVFWSLSVEEQFYAVWPAIVRFLSNKSFLAVCILLIAFCPLLRWYSFRHASRLGDVHMATLLIADHFAGGALLAIVLRDGLRLAKHAAIISLTLCVAGLTMILAGYRFGSLHRSNAIGATLQTEPFLFLFCGLLFFVLLPGVSAWMKKRKTLQFFGYISYGLYLYHEIFFRLYDTLSKRNVLPQVNGFFLFLVLRFAVSISAAIGFSWISRRYFEDYFLTLRQRRQERSAATGYNLKQNGIGD